MPVRPLIVYHLREFVIAGGELCAGPAAVLSPNIQYQTHISKRKNMGTNTIRPGIRGKTARSFNSRDFLRRPQKYRAPPMRLHTPRIAQATKNKIKKLWFRHTGVSFGGLTLSAGTLMIGEVVVKRRGRQKEISEASTRVIFLPKHFSASF